MSPDPALTARPAVEGAGSHPDEGGFVAGAESLLFGALIFVVGMVIAINAWGVVDTHMAADAVAREVARTLVESTPATATTTRLDDVATSVLVTMGRTPDVTLGYRDASGGVVTDPARLVTRCQRITVTATMSTLTVRLPFVGGWGSPWSLTGRHSEVIDPYRSGLAGEADCDG